MRFKKIYIEITNLCNLNCDFCIKNKRNEEIMNIENFEIILNKIKSYTNYIYLHVLGEPILNPKINEFIFLATKYKINVNLTTNGYLINKIEDNKNIRQINISLHSFNEKYNISLENYLNNIFSSIDKLIENGTYISLRLWVKSKYYNEIIQILNKKYNVNITNTNFKIKNNLFINFDTEFIWPDLNNNYCNEIGKCYGLKDQIGILVDGTVVPCCLDSLGAVNLGNIYESDLETLINSKKSLDIINGFKNNKKIEELCKHCNFIGR